MKDSVSSPSLALCGRVALYACATGVSILGGFLFAAGCGWSKESVESFFGIEGWKRFFILSSAGEVAMFLGAAALLQPFLEKKSSDSDLNLDNDRGKVRVSVRTISEYLQAKAIGLEGVDSLRIRVAGKDGKVELNVEASVTDSEPLPVITQRIQSFVEGELQDTIGLGKIESVNIHFKRIGGFSHAAALPAPKTESPPARSDEAETIDVSST